MTAVAVGFVLTVFASAPMNGFLFCNLNDDRFKFTSFMGAVTVGLIFGLTAGAPGIFTRLYVHSVRFLLGNNRVTHMNLLFVGIVKSLWPKVNPVSLL